MHCGQVGSNLSNEKQWVRFINQCRKATHPPDELSELDEPVHQDAPSRWNRKGNEEHRESCDGSNQPGTLCVV
jgi:hypothetical protein